MTLESVVVTRDWLSLSNLLLDLSSALKLAKEYPFFKRGSKLFQVCSANLICSSVPETMLASVLVQLVLQHLP